MAWKDLSIERRLVAAKADLMFSQPFFGALAVRLNLIECKDEKTCDTMATDGKSIYYWPPFVDKLSKQELVFVFVHEIMHCALKHHTRRQVRDPKKWDIATDYVINGELVATNIGKMPKEGLHNPAFTGMAAEEVYNLLPDGDGGSGGKGSNPGGGDPGGCGGVLDGGNSPAELAEASAEMDVALKQAASLAAKQAAGNMPASMQRIIDQLLKPVVDWQSVLRRFIDDAAGTPDFTWSRPNRRYLPMDIVLPSTRFEGIAHLAVAVDTSGSINAKVLQRFASEINGAFGDGIIDKITVVYCDAEVHNHQTFERGDDIRLDPQGGGGTRFAPAFAWLRENAQDARAIIFFTDLYCHDFGPEPDVPVLWGVYGDSRNFDELVGNTPFGEAISVTH